jgi:hypothetical protein
MSNRIIVFGYYNKQNLGDEMFKETIPLLFQDYQLDFMSIDSITDSIQLDNYNGLICGGGDLINNYFYNKLLIVTNKFNGLKIALGVGIPYSSLISKGYLDIFDYVFIREKADVRLIQRRLGSIYSNYLPDLGFLLEKPLSQRPYNKQIGIYMIQSIYKYTETVNSLIVFFEWLLQQGYTLTLYRFNTSDSIREDDKYINNYVFNKLDKYDNINMDNTKYNSNEMLNVIASQDYNICMRFHSHVFSTIANVPFLSIYPTRKVELFNKDIGLLDYSYKIPMSGNNLIEVNVDSLINIFNKVRHNYISIEEKLNNIQSEYQYLLQTDKVNRLLQLNIKRNTTDDNMNVDHYYDKIRTYLIDKTNYDPEIDDRSLINNITEDKADELVNV